MSMLHMQYRQKSKMIAIRQFWRGSTPKSNGFFPLQQSIIYKDSWKLLESFSRNPGHRQRDRQTDRWRWLNYCVGGGNKSFICIWFVFSVKWHYQFGNSKLPSLQKSCSNRTQMFPDGELWATSCYSGCSRYHIRPRHRPNFHIWPYLAPAGYGCRIWGRIWPSFDAPASPCNWAGIHITWLKLIF